MIIKKTSIIRMLQILVVFILSALFSTTSFAASRKPACDMKHLTQQAKIFNANIDPDLKVSIDVSNCHVNLVGRSCEITAFSVYQLTTLPRLPDLSMLQALKIQSFGPNSEGTGYILAIPKCAG